MWVAVGGDGMERAGRHMCLGEMGSERWKPIGLMEVDREVL